MDPLLAPESERSHQASNLDAADDPSNVLRSRSRRASTLPTDLSLLTTRFSNTNTSRPLYELGSPPDIILNDGKEQSDLADECDYVQRQITVSEGKGSEGASSVHKVEDLGFGAAPTSSCNSILDCLEVVSEKRKLRLSSRAQPPPQSACIQSQLKEEVEKALDRSLFDKEDYLPLDFFESIFNVESIALLLDETYDFATNEELETKFASIIDKNSGKSRRRILGVLVFMSRVAYLEHFIQQDIWDDQLPLEHSAGGSPRCVRTRSSENEKLMADWSRDEIVLFFSYQKIFFVPFFDIQENRLCYYELESNVTLPWKVFEHKSNGGFGVVYKVKIHPSHYKFAGSTSPDEPIFALKAIEAVQHDAYRDELSALEKTCAQIQKEKHLIKLLLTFRHGERFYLLFEWADGNLGEFWKKHPSEPTALLDERWAAEQCLGLARAVRQIHGLTTWQKNDRSLSNGSLGQAERDWGRHGDIKPENILWFEKYGTDHNLLVISDLGLTRYHSRVSKSFVPRSHLDGCSWAYRPPELDIDNTISQKYDIWSLGCVFLEFCVWYLQGYSAVEDFSMEREDEDVPTYERVQVEKFFNIKESGDGKKRSHVKTAVKERLKILNNLSIEKLFTNRLLYVIEHHMLQCAPNDRQTIDVICADLLEILASLPKETNRERLSQDLAFIRRQESTPSLQAPGRISLNEGTRDWAIDSSNAPTGGGGDSGRTREGHQDHASSADVRRDSKTPTANSVAATLQKRTKGQSAENVPAPKHSEASSRSAAAFSLPDDSPSMTRAHKTKHRISQKSKKWLQSPINYVKRIFKG